MDITLDTYSRLRADFTGVGRYDPTRAKRTLALLASTAVAAQMRWTLPDPRAMDDLRWLLGWFGVPAERIAADDTGLQVRLTPGSGLSAESMAQGLRHLARAMPFHDLRMVSAEVAEVEEVEEVEEILTVMDLLMACGVDRGRLQVDLVGDWELVARDRQQQVLRERYRLDDDQVQARRRKARQTHVALTVRGARGSEMIQAWSLTYTLIMLYVYVKATVPMMPSEGA